ncbi:MAG: hypothetical protein LBQ30_08920 [Treponema sp.]|jgi:regulator of protease activity HflC (stomatin/prohibitin superfamily)|nr:hypothetical protein [Treponema sp.]
MREQPVLRHLLQMETEAAALVDDAQAEADRRLAEGEKQNRRRYDERYGREAASIDAEYAQKRAEAQAAYQRELDAYRESLQGMICHGDRFSALVTAALSRSGLPVKEP